MPFRYPRCPRVKELQDAIRKLHNYTKRIGVALPHEKQQLAALRAELHTFRRTKESSQ